MDKRPAARMVFAQKAVWLRCSSVDDPPGIFSFVAPRHTAFCAKTAPLIIFRQALRNFRLPCHINCENQIIERCGIGDGRGGDRLGLCDGVESSIYREPIEIAANDELDWMFGGWKKRLDRSNRARRFSHSDSTCGNWPAKRRCGHLAKCARQIIAKSPVQTVLLQSASAH